MAVTQDAADALAAGVLPGAARVVMVDMEGSTIPIAGDTTDMAAPRQHLRQLSRVQFVTFGLPEVGSTHLALSHTIVTCGHYGVLATSEVQDRTVHLYTAHHPLIVCLAETFLDGSPTALRARACRNNAIPVIPYRVYKIGLIAMAQNALTVSFAQPGEVVLAAITRRHRALYPRPRQFRPRTRKRWPRRW
jgi:hypothetical protein